MADDKNNPDEPSIEEILSSIREIISEDDEVEVVDTTTKQANEAKTVKASVTQSSEDDDVLDLAAFEEEDKPEETEPETKADDVIGTVDPLDGIDLNHSESDDVDMVDAGADKTIDEDGLAAIFDEDEEEDIAAFEAEEVISEAEPEKDTLVDKVAETATIGAMAKLAENISLARAQDGVTLEDIVRDLLRPMLKNWLDDNLPDIIERLVSQELERLSQKAVRK
jgi:cell pole-organizing protein PopZ